MNRSKVEIYLSLGLSKIIQVSNNVRFFDVDRNKKCRELDILIEFETKKGISKKIGINYHGYPYHLDLNQFTTVSRMVYDLTTPIFYTQKENLIEVITIWDNGKTKDKSHWKWQGNNLIVPPMWKEKKLRKLLDVLVKHIFSETDVLENFKKKRISYYPSFKEIGELTYNVSFTDEEKLILAKYGLNEEKVKGVGYCDIIEMSCPSCNGPLFESLSRIFQNPNICCKKCGYEHSGLKRRKKYTQKELDYLTSLGVNLKDLEGKVLSEKILFPCVQCGELHEGTINEILRGRMLRCKKCINKNIGDANKKKFSQEEILKLKQLNVSNEIIENYSGNRLFKRICDECGREYNTTLIKLLKNNGKCGKCLSHEKLLKKYTQEELDYLESRGVDLKELEDKGVEDKVTAICPRCHQPYLVQIKTLLSQRTKYCAKCANEVAHETQHWNFLKKHETLFLRFGLKIENLKNVKKSDKVMANCQYCGFVHETTLRNIIRNPNKKCPNCKHEN